MDTRMDRIGDGFNMSFWGAGCRGLRFLREWVNVRVRRTVAFPWLVSTH